MNVNPHARPSSREALQHPVSLSAMHLVQDPNFDTDHLQHPLVSGYQHADRQ